MGRQAADRNPDRGGEGMNDPDKLDLDDLFAGQFPDDEVETLQGISARRLIVDHKRETFAKLRKESAEQMVVTIAKLIGRPIETFRASTWTMNRQNVRELLAMIDAGTLQDVGFLTGLYFKRRETAVYASLMNGLTARGKRLRCLENHAKVAILIAPPDFIVLEGSANFTENPRIEQNIIANDRRLAEFHREWIDQVLKS
jgi:uncharacterized protein YjiS (DUF1127 family)